MPELGWEILKKDYKELILKGMKKGKLYTLPKSVEIDWTDRCNLSCLFCWQKPMQLGEEMPYEKLKKIFDEMEELGIETLQVSGGGEPLFHKEIKKILSDLENRNFKIGNITTNGILLNDEIQDFLIKVVRRQITVSLNAHKKDYYSYIMNTPEKNFDLVINNIKKFKEKKERQKFEKPHLAVQFLINGDNFLEIIDMYRFGKEIGADFIGFNPMCLWREGKEKFIEKKGEFLEKVKKLYEIDEKRIILGINTLIPELNLEIQKLREENFKGLYKATSKMERNYNLLHTFCAILWFHFHIKANGNVYPCCILLNPDFIPFGNVFEESIEKIWKSKNYNKMRKEMSKIINGKNILFVRLPKVCKIHGMCFLRALPYLDDTEFSISVDTLVRGKKNLNINFPSIIKGEKRIFFKKKEFKGAKKISVFLNQKPFVFLENSHEILFDFSFLPPGLHLIEIFNEKNKILFRKVFEIE